MNDKALAVKMDMSLSGLGKVLATSGFFADARQEAQAIVKVLAGNELGLGPIASMTGINVIQGRISLSANIIAAAIKRSARYDYRVKEMTEKVCTIHFYENKEQIGVSTFTHEDAVKAGTKNLDRFPRNMLFARAISNGARWYCPDVFSGSPVYTPEELGADVNEDGEVINAETVTTNQAAEHFDAIMADAATLREALPGAVVTEVREPIPDVNPDEMTYQQAYAVQDSEGNPYGSKTTDQLKQIKKHLEKLNRTEAEDYKLEAVNLLLNHPK